MKLFGDKFNKNANKLNQSFNNDLFSEKVKLTNNHFNLGSSEKREQPRFILLMELFVITVSLGSLLIGLNQINFFFNNEDLMQTAIGSQTVEVDFDILDVAEADDGEDSNANILGAFESSSQVTIKTVNLQAYLFDKWLYAQKSPLAGHGEDFVNACRQYGAPADCTLLLGIAKVETAYCTTDISAKQFNCWGFGGSGPNRILYESFEESIDSITSRLMTGYGAYFFENPEWGGLTYCGSHCVNWGRYVKSEQTRIKSYLRENGFNDF